MEFVLGMSAGLHNMMNGFVYGTSFLSEYISKMKNMVRIKYFYHFCYYYYYYFKSQKVFSDVFG